MDKKTQYSKVVSYSGEDINNLRFIVMKIIVVAVFKIFFCLLTATTIIIIARKSPEWSEAIVYSLFCIMILSLFMAGLYLINIIQAAIAFMNLYTLDSYVLTSLNLLKKFKCEDYCNLCESLTGEPPYRYYCVSPIKMDHHLYIYKVEQIQEGEGV